MINEEILLVRLFIMFIFSFLLFTFTGILIGNERKAKWFKKRTKYSIFTRRSIIGEFIHFGRPYTLEGYLLTIFLFIIIFGGGYWFLFCYQG